MKTLQELRFFLEKKIESEKKEIQDLLNSSDPKKDEKILLIKYIIANQTAKLKFMRPQALEDANYRKRQLGEFEDMIKKILPESTHFLFHGTPIYNAEKILKTGYIVSGKDLWHIPTSGNKSGEISVTTKKNFHTTLLGYSGLTSTHLFLPAGVIFVLRPKDEAEYQIAEQDCQIHNVHFKDNPQRLFGVITTPENKEQVQCWMKQFGHNQPVFDYDGFIRHFQRQPVQSQVLSNQKTIF